MKNYTKKEINFLIERFEAEKLPKAEWTHEAHLVVAVWYCSKHSLEKALPIVRRNITNHNTSVGTPNTDTEGYHETITKFWLIIASEFLKTQSEPSIDVSCNSFINSVYAQSNFPLNFYSEQLLFSVKARHHWVEPDLRELFLTIQ